jgi:tetratricopeptide (TPR) repeat protein
VSEARKAIEQSLSVRGQEDKNSNIAERLSSLGEILRQEDQLTGARKAFEEALALEYETGTPKAVAEKRLLLAELSLEENSPVAAEAEATEADGKLTLERVPHLHALAVIAQALVAQHKLAEARNAIEQVVPSLNDIPRYMDRLSTMIIIGRMIAMSGNRRRGMKYVNSALADASRLGYGGLQLEARLARCEIRIMSINDATDLKQLRTEAQAKGLNLIARKAAALDARRR